MERNKFETITGETWKKSLTSARKRRLMRGTEIREFMNNLKTDLTWRPIETAPEDGTYILLAGDSGYSTTPLRVEVCRYDAKYRPLQPWVNHSNDSFLDGGAKPLYWHPLLLIPNKVVDDPSPIAEYEIQFPIGPGRYVTGLLIKADNRNTRTKVDKKRFVGGKLEVKLPDGAWYQVQTGDYFGANV